MTMDLLFFDSDGMPDEQVIGILDTLKVQRQRWIAGFHPDGRIRNLAFNHSGVSVHRSTFISIGMVVLDGYEHIVRIGERCSFGNYVSLVAASSPNDSVLAHHPELARAVRTAPITIGNDCWIGSGATIMPGVSVGDKAVVGAGAVVTKNVGEYEVVAGVPAAVVRKLGVV